MGSFSGLDKMLAAPTHAIERVLGAQQHGLTKFIAQYQGQLQSSIDLIGQNLARGIAAMVESKRWQAHHERYATAMLALGWPPVMDLYVDQTREIISRFDPDDPASLADEVSDFLVEFFDESSLVKKLQEWRELRWVDSRIGILEKVVRAHVDGNYELSVPAMLPQIEGVVASGFAYTGQLTGRELDRLYDRLLSADDDVTGAAFREFIGTVLLVGFKHGEPLGSNFSRHAILHGADTQYATPANSLRAILLFDYLVSSFRLVGLEGSPAFHMPGCAHVLRSDRRRDVFPTVWVAEESGRTPCMVCRPDLNRGL